MKFFNRAEYISDYGTQVDPLMDRIDILFAAITKSQDALAEWIVPDSKTTDKEVLGKLLGILDDKDLVKFIKDESAPF